MPLTRKQRRLSVIALGGVLLAIAAALILVALEDTIVFFRSPSDVVEKKIAPGIQFRLGGLVREGSLSRKGTRVTFSVTDLKTDLKVTFDGILPDLFREGQGVVAEGKLAASGIFVADRVLAKHDETYMPREVADSLKKQGLWRPAGKP